MLIAVVRPDFADVMAVKKGHHPLLDRVAKNVTPNDVVSAVTFACGF